MQALCYIESILIPIFRIYLDTVHTYLLNIDLYIDLFIINHKTFGSLFDLKILAEYLCKTLYIDSNLTQ